MSCSDEAGVVLLSGDVVPAAVSNCELSALVAVPAGIVMTTRSARLLPNTNADWAELESVVLVTTVVLVATAYNIHTIVD